MSELTLREMIDVASRYAERAMRQYGAVRPKWHIQTRRGDDVVLEPPPVNDKDLIAALMKCVLEEVGAVRAVFIDEVWYVDEVKDMEAIDDWLNKHGSLRDYPGRVEAVIFNAEDDDGRMLCGRREILRPPGGKPTLGLLEIDAPEISYGRFVGMLPTKGTKQ